MKQETVDSGKALEGIQNKFRLFRQLLDKNNQALMVISDLEEKSQGDYLFDMNYIASSLQELRKWVKDIIENMILLGGDKYLPLRESYAGIDDEVESILPGRRPIREDAYVVSFDEIDKDRSYSVGGKNAQLGELKTKLKMPVPDGFAITAWAYKRFIENGDLQEKISELIDTLNPKSYQDLIRVSSEIRRLFLETPVSEDVAGEIFKACERLSKNNSGCSLAFRSSALGEDTQFSFAGRYTSFLNVKQEEMLDKYREVLASKFTPKAIYYLFSQGLSEFQLAMSVGCVKMVDAAASGVMYSRDPTDPNNGNILINSIYGLGSRIVDGTVNPDIFCVSREDGRVTDSRITVKQSREVMNPDGGIMEEPVPESEKLKPSVNDEQLKELSELASGIEQYYGSPQDIEWAIDREGRIALLQTRPLRMMRRRESEVKFDPDGLEVICSQGISVCPGAGCGKVYLVKGPDDLVNVPKGAVLTAAHPFPGLITVLDKISALVTEVGGAASHIATIAREFNLPAIAGAECVSDIENGMPVTVDATAGRIYKGIHKDLIASRKTDDLFEDSEIFDLLYSLLAKIAPLHLLNPSTPDFKLENCSTFHDLTRYCHQKSMEEMFTGAKEFAGRRKISCVLNSELPLEMNIIYLDQDPAVIVRKRQINDDDFASDPMQGLWEGIKKEGWHAAQPANFKSFASSMTPESNRKKKSGFSQNSYAILSKEYMIVSLRMGYHFTTIEAMVTDEPNKNYIRMQYKEGGAVLEKRVRRIKLIMDLLNNMGFEHHSGGDFLDSILSYSGREETRNKLMLLGRITMMTKQLDMALSNDQIAEWYYQDFLKQLGLDK